MQERVCLGKRLKIGIRASSTLAWYKNGGRENDKVMYNLNMVLSLCSSRQDWSVETAKLISCPLPLLFFTF